MQKINIQAENSTFSLSFYPNILKTIFHSSRNIEIDRSRRFPSSPKSRNRNRKRRRTAKKSQIERSSSLIYTRQRMIRIDSQVRFFGLLSRIFDGRNWHRREIVSPRSRPPPRRGASLSRNNTGRDYKSHGLFLNRVQKFLRIYSAVVTSTGVEVALAPLLSFARN